VPKKKKPLQSEANILAAEAEDEYLADKEAKLKERAAEVQRAKEAGIAKHGQPPAPRHFEATNEEYHKMPGVSHSQLEVFIDDPATYYGRFITKRIARPKPTEAMIFGSAAHDWLLESGGNIVQIPGDVLSSSGSRAGGKWKAFEAQNPGKLLMKAHELIPLRIIEDNIREHAEAAKLISKARRFEYPIEWTDQETGLLCRCKVDFLGDACLSDFKTAKSVKPKLFSTQAYNLGYHRQADWYTDGVEAFFGKRLPFVFTAAKSTEPYSIETIQLDDDFMELAAIQNRQARIELAECMETGRWHSKTHGKIIKVAPPGWTKYLDQWELESV